MEDRKGEKESETKGREAFGRLGGEEMGNEPRREYRRGKICQKEDGGGGMAHNPGPHNEPEFRTGIQTLILFLVGEHVESEGERERCSQ